MLRLAAAFAVMASAGPALSAPPARAELMAKAGEALSLCAEHMPDSRKTRQALRDAGFRKELAADDSAEYFSALGYRVVIAVTMTHARADACGVSVANATPAEAQSLLQPLIAATRARPTSLSDGSDRAWLGKFKGEPMLLFVEDFVDLGPLRGAAAIARSVK